MAKRFTDSEKWQNKFFRGLSNEHKLLWLFIHDDCNHAGMWEVDFPLVKFRLGIKFNEEETLKVFEENILIFDNGNKWFIKTFIKLQYKQLNPTVKAHYSVIEKLKEFNLEALSDDFDF